MTKTTIVLLFLSKSLESIVAAHLQICLDNNSNIFEPFQSGFGPKPSTETALVQMANNLLCAANSGQLSILLDLPLAVDTIPLAPNGSSG